MRVLIQHKDVLKKFIVVESSPRDGSLSLSIRQGGPSFSGISWGAELEEVDSQQKSCSGNKRITIHQTGRVNYHENGSSVFIEPLTSTTQVTYLYGCRLPALDRLDLHAANPREKDVVFDLSDIGDIPVSFSIFIGPLSTVPDSRAIQLNYNEEAYSLIIAVDKELAAVPLGYEDCFTTLTPVRGVFFDQQMAEDQAIICYHKAINHSNSAILYKPNGEGFFKLIFSVPMRIAPKFRMELVDQKLHVTDQDVCRDGRSDKVMLKFKVRDRRTKQIIKDEVAIKSIELDAEL